MKVTGIRTLWLFMMLMPLHAQGQEVIVVEYIHTDAQGTPIAVTDASGTVIERFEYEPYGLQVAGTVEDGPGYTGHVEDTLTGMTYMQQRYYDPAIGRFDSVDAVTALQGGPQHFNSYDYAYNNPYKFTDRDGRCPQCLWGIPLGAGVNLAVQMATAEGSFTERWNSVSWKQVGVAGVAGGLSGGISVVASTAGTTTGAVVANVVGNAGVGALATQASAQVEGKTASVGEVLQGAALSGSAAGLGAAAEAAPGALARTASSGMSQTQRTATENLLNGIKQTTPGFKYSNPTQTAANVVGAGVSASPDLKPVLDKEKDDL